MANAYATERELERDITPAVQGRLPDVEVLAVELLSPTRFCVYVDHPEGVDHALCERVTRLLDGYRVDYTIDVSSPGPERPVRTAAHFERALGRSVAIRTENEIGGTRRFRGVIAAAGRDHATIRTAEGELDIPYEAIVRGNLIDDG